MTAKLLPSNQPKKLTGKQLISALKKAVKSKIIHNSDFSCVLGSWGDDFPTMRFKLALSDDKYARFDVEMTEVSGEGHCKIYNMNGDSKELDVVNVVKVSRILFEEDDVWANTIVKREEVKDIELLEKYLKEIFNGLCITTNEVDGEYEGETYSLRSEP